MIIIDTDNPHLSTHTFTAESIMEYIEGFNKENDPIAQVIDELKEIYIEGFQSSIGTEWEQREREDPTLTIHFTEGWGRIRGYIKFDPIHVHKDRRYNQEGLLGI